MTFPMMSWASGTQRPSWKFSASGDRRNKILLETCHENSSNIICSGFWIFWHWFWLFASLVKATCFGEKIWKVLAGVTLTEPKKPLIKATEHWAWRLGVGFAQESTNVRSPKDWKERLQKSISASWIRFRDASRCISGPSKSGLRTDSLVLSRSWEAMIMRFNKCQVCQRHWIRHLERRAGMRFDALLGLSCFPFGRRWQQILVGTPDLSWAIRSSHHRYQSFFHHGMVRPFEALLSCRDVPSWVFAVDLRCWMPPGPIRAVQTQESCVVTEVSNSWLD